MVSYGPYAGASWSQTRNSVFNLDFDDSALATVTWPDLTTIHRPAEKMGEIAARKLLAQLNGNAETVDLPIATEPELIIRHSTKNHP